MMLGCKGILALACDGKIMKQISHPSLLRSSAHRAIPNPVPGCLLPFAPSSTGGNRRVGSFRKFPDPKFLNTATLQSKMN